MTALAQRHGVRLAQAYEEVRLALAARDIAGLLGIEAGTKLMQLDRVMLSIEQVPIEWRSISCHMREEYYSAEVV